MLYFREMCGFTLVFKNSSVSKILFFKRKLILLFSKNALN